MELLFNVIPRCLSGPVWCPLIHFGASVSILLAKQRCPTHLALHYVPPQYPESIGECLRFDAIKTLSTCGFIRTQTPLGNFSHWSQVWRRKRPENHTDLCLNVKDGTLFSVCSCIHTNICWWCEKEFTLLVLDNTILSRLKSGADWKKVNLTARADFLH